MVFALKNSITIIFLLVCYCRSEIPCIDTYCYSNELEYIQQLLELPSSTYGAQDKSGALPDPVWKDAQLGKTITQGRLERCEILINHNYKFVYLRNLKAASSAVIDAFGPSEKCIEGYMREGTKKWDSCLSVLSTDTTDEELKRIWDEYYVFSFFNNPWQRAASCWKMYNSVFQWEEKEECNVPFTKFCLNPYLVMTSLCRQSPDCCKVNADNQPKLDLIFMHHQSQSACFLTSAGLPAADFIGRAENFVEDLNEIVAEINKRKSSSLPPIPEVTAKPPAEDIATLAGYYAESQICLHHATNYYGDDVTFGYLRQPRARHSSVEKEPQRRLLEEPGVAGTARAGEGASQSFFDYQEVQMDEESVFSESLQ